MLNRDWGAWLDEPRRARWLAAAILLIGFGVRAYYAPLGHFSLDLATTFTNARHVAHGTEFPVIGGVTSWGGRVPFPGLFYVTAPPLLFSDSVVLFVWWGVLLATGAMACFVCLLFERYGPRAAVVGAVLVSFSPWFIIGGDAPWAPKLALSVFALFLYALHRTVAVDRSRWGAVVPLALILQAHVYANIVITLAVLGAVVLCARPKLNWPWVLSGGIVGALTVLPSIWHLFLGGTDDLGKVMQRAFKFSLAREVFQTGYFAMVFGTAENSYNLNLGFWRHDIANLYDMGWSGLRTVYGGYSLVAAFVLVTMAVATAAWGRAAYRGILNVTTKPMREWDPMGVALVAALVAGAATMLISKREYHPRYTFIIAWLSLMPMIWLVAGQRPVVAGWLRNLATAWFVVAVAGCLWVASAYYVWTVPPYSVTTAEQVLKEVAERTNGRSFSLRYPRPIAQRGMELIGEELYGEQWTAVPKAEVRYYVVASPMSPEALKLSAEKGVQTIELHDAMLLEVPASVSRPKKLL